jgi:hypothetical protein
MIDKENLPYTFNVENAEENKAISTIIHTEQEITEELQYLRNKYPYKM